jgi:hypothetical protein
MKPTQEQYDKYVREIESELEEERKRSGDLARANHGQMNLFNQENEENLIRWQLDLKEDLDRLYHLLKGDILFEDDDGNVFYKSPDSPDLKPFNEFGVQLIMNIMSFYLNRNTILSNYDEEVINWKVYDLGYEIADLIHNRYQEMMLTLDVESEIKELTGYIPRRLKNGKLVVGLTYSNGKIVYEELDDSIMEYIDDIVTDHLREKLKLFPMIVRELVDTVHSAYLRAYNGGERESLRTARTVTQNEPLYGRNPMMQQSMNTQKVRRWYNPATW